MSSASIDEGGGGGRFDGVGDDDEGCPPRAGLEATGEMR